MTPSKTTVVSEMVESYYLVDSQKIKKRIPRIDRMKTDPRAPGARVEAESMRLAGSRADSLASELNLN